MILAALRNTDIWQNILVLWIKNLCLRKKLSKVNKQRHYHISYHGLRVNGRKVPSKWWAL